MVLSGSETERGGEEKQREQILYVLRGSAEGGLKRKQETGHFNVSVCELTKKARAN